MPSTSSTVVSRIRSAHSDIYSEGQFHGRLRSRSRTAVCCQHRWSRRHSRLPECALRRSRSQRRRGLLPEGGETRARSGRRLESGSASRLPVSRACLQFTRRRCHSRGTAEHGCGVGRWSIACGVAIRWSGAHRRVASAATVAGGGRHRLAAECSACALRFAHLASTLTPGTPDRDSFRRSSSDASTRRLTSRCPRGATRSSPGAWPLGSRHQCASDVSWPTPCLCPPVQARPLRKTTGRF